MKSLLYVVTFASILCAPAYADDTHHAQAQTNASATPAPATGQSAGMPPAMMDSMKKMHEQMAKIQQTSDPKERERLMQEHMQLMQTHMKAMGGMMAQGMKPAEGTDAPTEKRMQMMQARMDMMQQMMDQMLGQQEALMEMMRRK
ncbi:MAG: hypothetical protein HY308_07890 [Gammaproteobacteria bacterium]|nr:hypothetical protein [Gammaproteobacteria bacterium]